jgi:hypothetical protein
MSRRATEYLDWNVSAIEAWHRGAKRLFVRWIQLHTIPNGFNVAETRSDAGLDLFARRRLAEGDPESVTIADDEFTHAIKRIM